MSDMVADLGASDATAYLDEGIGLGSFPEKADNWHARSSIYRIHRNHAPLLLLQADDDLRCPPVHSEIPYVDPEDARSDGRDGALPGRVAPAGLERVGLTGASIASSASSDGSRSTFGD